MYEVIILSLIQPISFSSSFLHPFILPKPNNFFESNRASSELGWWADPTVWGISPVMHEFVWTKAGIELRQKC